MHVNRVTPERTGFRDEALSRRHREYGFNVPMVDVDMLVVEYDYGTAKALMEYKHMNNYDGDNINIHRTNYTAIAQLGDNNLTPIPFYIARYESDPFYFRVRPANITAQTNWPEGETWINFTEYDFVSFLYRLRGRNIEDHLHEIAELNTERIWENN